MRSAQLENWGPLVGALHQAFQAGDESHLRDLLDELCAAHHRTFSLELQALVARLELTIDQFRLDPRLLAYASEEMPHARLRLDHVLRLTEDAAHHTIDLVERSAPLAERVAREANVLLSDWARLDTGTRGAGFDELACRVQQHLAAAQHDCETVRAYLGEVLMAQSYQDLSGQIIRRVIELVTELEFELAHFAHGARAAGCGDRPSQGSTSSSDRAFGSALPAVSADTVGGQHDVDALLAGDSAKAAP